MEYVVAAIGAIAAFLIVVGALGIHERREMNARIASRLPVAPRRA